MAKIVLIVAVVLSLAAAVLAFVTQGKVAGIKQERDAFKESSAQKDTQIAQSKKEVKSAQDEATQAKAQVASVQAEADAAKSAAKDLQTKIDDVTKQLADANATIEKIKGNAPVNPSSSDAEKIVVLTKQVEDLTKERDELKTVNTTLQTRVASESQENDSMRKAEDNRVRRLQIPGLEGQVVAVNQAYGFVVLAVGDRKGITVDSPMVVKRGGSMIAKVRVSSVEPSTSIADVVPGSVAKGTYIQPGDQAIVVGRGEGTGAIAPPGS